MRLEKAWNDLRYATRLLAKSPGFTLLAVSALALGIGATTGMYTVFDTVLVRPLRFPQPDRLVMLWEVQPSKRNNVIQTQNFLDWRERNHSFESISAMLQLPVNLTGIGDPLQVTGLSVTADFFRVLNVSPLAGRFFSPEEDVQGNPRAVILEYSLYSQRYGAQTDIIGKKISVNGTPLEVVGVMPPGFGLPNLKADIYMPLQLPKSAPRDGRNFRAIARLRPGISLEQAREEMEAIARQTAAERPEFNKNWSATAVPLLEQIVGNVRSALAVLFGSVIFLLMIACANVANLLLMRASARRREMTVRLALGARQTDLLRQLMIESLLLAGLGGVAGVLFANIGIRTILTSLPSNFPLPRLQEIHIDSRILIFTTVVTLSVGLIFGMFPALSLRRERLSESLSENSRSVVRGQRRVAVLLVGLEVAVALMLVVGAALMIRSFERLTSVDAGFRSDHVLTARMLLLPSKYNRNDRRAAVIHDILDRIRSLPEITSAGSIHFLPMSGTNSGTWYYRSDRPEPQPGNKPGGDVSIISDGYFRTLGIPFTSGRDFDGHDSLNAPKVTILNQSAAQMLFPGEDPVGKHVTVDWDQHPDAEVVGVVADARHDNLNHEAGPCLFLPESQEPHMLLSLVIRTSANPERLSRAVEEQIHTVDPDQGIAEIKTMDELISDSVASPRLQSFLVSVFGFVALILAAVGIYGTISHSVVQQTREIGVRLAIGATPGAILRYIVRDGLMITAGGAICGTIGAFALTNYMQGMLYNVSAQDPVVFAAVVGVIFTVAIIACLIPAWRASRVDPATVLHND